MFKLKFPWKIQVLKKTKDMKNAELTEYQKLVTDGKKIGSISILVIEKDGKEKFLIKQSGFKERNVKTITDIIEFLKKREDVL